MEQPSKTTKASPDRISSLPDDIRAHVLTFLPLRDAAKASLLSTKWRNMVTQLPSLVFDETFLHPIASEPNPLLRVTADLYTALLLHRGSLLEFSLSLPLPSHYLVLVDRIILVLQEKHAIDSLTLAVGKRNVKYSSTPSLKEEEDYYKLPKSFFSSSSSTTFSSRLKTLRLGFCKIVSSSPPSFESFGMLNVLELRNVAFKELALAPLRFRCPLLSALTLFDCSCSLVEQPDVVIEAPKLGFFLLDGKFGSLDLKDSPLLKTAVLRKQQHSDDSYKEEGDDDDRHSKMLKLCGALAVVESLSMSYHFYMWLARGSLGRWEMLRHKTLDEVCLSNGKDIRDVVRLVIISPNLQRLVIEMEEISDTTSRSLRQSEDVCKLQGMIKVSNDASELRRLKRVEVKRLNVTKHEAGLVAWLLNSAPALEQMEIHLSKTSSAAEKMLFLAKLNEFQRASNKARIVVK